MTTCCGGRGVPIVPSSASSSSPPDSASPPGLHCCREACYDWCLNVFSRLADLDVFNKLCCLCLHAPAPIVCRSFWA